MKPPSAPVGRPRAIASLKIPHVNVGMTNKLWSSLENEGMSRHVRIGPKSVMLSPLLERAEPWKGKMSVVQVHNEGRLIATFVREEPGAKIKRYLF